MSADEQGRPRVGVLAMQGAFAEHVRMLEACGAEPVEVRTAGELEGVDGLVLPGGESTAIRKALDRCGLLEPLRARIAAGMPAFGTCAGMIVLADTEPDGAPPCLAALDVRVERNGYGRQVASFEAPVRLGDTSVPGIFIRAPRILASGTGVEVVGTLDLPVEDGRAGEPVVVEQGSLLAATFHPELSGDETLHRRFVERVRAAP